jgi:hypothetical protein
MPPPAALISVNGSELEIVGLLGVVASHISGIAHLPVLTLSFHSLIGILSIVRNRLAILIYAYLVLKASLLIKAAFRRSRIVNIDG